MDLLGSEGICGIEYGANMALGTKAEIWVRRRKFNFR